MDKLKGEKIKRTFLFFAFVCNEQEGTQYKEKLNIFEYSKMAYINTTVIMKQEIAFQEFYSFNIFQALGLAASFIGT
jgi:hypothetical protein